MRRLHALVLAGGAGRRLEGIVREIEGRPLPKQYCAFGRRHTLLQETLTRTALLTPRLTWVAVQENHLAVARSQAAGAVLVPQPGDRGTAVGVLLPLLHILRADPEALVVLTPSDHGVHSAGEWTRGIATACAAVEARRAGIVLLGVEASEPRTDYGWIRPGPPLGGGLRRVLQFREKPEAGEAGRLLATGALWNTMVLVGRGSDLLALFRRLRPELTRRLEEEGLEEGVRGRGRLRRLFASLDRWDFSHEVVGAALGLAVYRWRRRLGWSDLGTPERLLAWLSGARAAQVAEA